MYWGRHLTANVRNGSLTYPEWGFDVISRLTCGLMFCALTSFMPGALQSAEVIKTAILRVQVDAPLPLSRLDLPPVDLGLSGGRLGTSDNNTTGRFLGQSYETTEQDTTPAEAVQAAEQLVQDGNQLIVTMAPAETLVALSDALGDQALILNAAARDDALRVAGCHPNILHVAPSRAMLADGLAQYLVWKKWTEWVLVPGSHPGDVLMAEAYRRSAKKFGAKIVEERPFEDTGGARRSDSGHVLVQRQIPVFMQRLDDHDVVVAADESSVFADYLPYRTWDARPVAGSAGLRPKMWHDSHESWGATQIQRRFEKAAKRGMRDLDYQVWLAIRVIGEAVTRTKSTNPAVLKAFIRSDDFEVAGFKGQALNFRPWNNQLRHGVLLTDGQLVVSVSPQDEFLHQKTRLDTLGFDQPESDCQLN